MKITFMGAGSSVFARKIISDCMLVPSLCESTFALYDIDPKRLEESKLIIDAVNKGINESRAKIETYLGVEKRKDALRGATFVINAIQVGGYDPCTITDFEIPKKYGIQQTIGDTLGIGGIFRALRTIPVLEEFANDMAEVCPDCLFLNYTNPMAMLTGYMLRYTPIKTVGLCHSVQGCSLAVMNRLGLEDKLEGRSDLVAGINHMAWLLDVKDRDGNDLYPEIKRLAKEKNLSKHDDMVRFDYIDKLGYHCTESSEHNSEYNPFYLKSKYPELIEKFNIPIDLYLRRCVSQIEGWDQELKDILAEKEITWKRSVEYASYIMEAMTTDVPCKIGGNVLNTELIDNLPSDACVEVPCLVDGQGIHPCRIGNLPLQLAAMNCSNIYPQLLTIEAAVTKKKEYIYQAAMMDPHTGSELSIDDIISLCDDLIEAHKGWLPEYH